MKLMTMKQYMNMSKPALIRKITKTLRVMPKVKLARLCYNLTKAKLPRLRKITSRQIGVKRKTKSRFSRKQLAAQRLFAKRARAGTLQRRDSGWYKGVRKRRR